MYSNPDNLAKLLGIEKLPDFTREQFECPAIDKYLTDKQAQQELLSKVSAHNHPPATTEELQSTLELFKMGMHYVEHKTRGKVDRELQVVDKSVWANSDDSCSFIRVGDSQYYELTYKHIAGLIENLRDSEVYIDAAIHHAPRMELKSPATIVVAGAEEAHHAVTYAENPELHGKSDKKYRRRKFPTVYYKQSMELAFGEFLPGLVTDFGFDVRQASILSKISQLKGDLSEEAYIKLYNKRLGERIHSKWLGSDEPSTPER